MLRANPFDSLAKFCSNSDSLLNSSSETGSFQKISHASGDCTIGLSNGDGIERIGSIEFTLAGIPP